MDTPKPGPQAEITKERVDEVFSNLESSDPPALTATMIAKRLNVTRQSVHRMLEKEGKAMDWDLKSGKIGNSTAYWKDSDITSVHNVQHLILGALGLGISTIILVLLTFVPRLLAQEGAWGWATELVLFFGLLSLALFIFGLLDEFKQTGSLQHLFLDRP